MLAVLPLILGIQLLLPALQSDIQGVPAHPLQEQYESLPAPGNAVDR